MWRERFFPAWTFRLRTGRRQLLLTFDDGPHPESTNALLDTLNALHLPSVMYLNGDKCTRYPHLVRDIQQAGHQIALHGMSHQSVLLKSAAFVCQSIHANQAAILAAGANPLPFYRPPYGRFNPCTASALRQTAHSGMLWSALAADWKNTAPDLVWKKLQPQLMDGAIVLLHDSPQAIAKHKFVLARIADFLKQQQLSAVLLPLQCPAGNL